MKILNIFYYKQKGYFSDNVSGEYLRTLTSTGNNRITTHYFRDENNSDFPIVGDLELDYYLNQVKIGCIVKRYATGKNNKMSGSDYIEYKLEIIPQERMLLC